MRNRYEVQLAWVLWNMLLDLEDWMWKRYEKHFLEFYMKEEELKFYREALSLDFLKRLIERLAK